EGTAGRQTCGDTQRAPRQARDPHRDVPDASERLHQPPSTESTPRRRPRRPQHRHQRGKDDRDERGSERVLARPARPARREPLGGSDGEQREPTNSRPNPRNGGYTNERSNRPLRQRFTPRALTVSEWTPRRCSTFSATRTADASSDYSP